MPALILAPAARRPATLVVACCAAVVALLAWRYAGTSGPSPADAFITDAAVERTAQYPFLTWAAVQIGDPLPVITVSVVLAVVCFALRRTALAAVAIAGPGLTGLLTTLLKPALGRTIEGDPTFPSSHTAGVTAVALVVALLVTGLARSRVVTVAAVAGLGVVLAAATVATGLVVGGFHYPTDTVGGFCVAVVVVLGMVLFIERVRPPVHSP